MVTRDFEAGQRSPPGANATACNASAERAPEHRRQTSRRRA
ncbi:Hypothetical protein A7982_05009 [Minicystis rosea]|nr:Hypothetical protein A7982_05009 [Minicystis rosea]